MWKKVVIIISFIASLFASFSIGFLVNDNTNIPGITDEPNDSNDPNENINIPANIDDVDAAFIEVMNELMENHYKKPSKELLVEGAIEGMIDALEDPFTSYFDFEEAQSYTSSFGESYVGIGVKVQFLDTFIVVESVVPNGPADMAGIRPNDIISSVDGVSTFGAAFYETVGKIIGEESTEVIVGIKRVGFEDEILLPIIRATIDNPTVTYTTFDRLGQTVGYIEVNTFGAQTDVLFRDAINDLESVGMDSLVIDLRVNGGGYLLTVRNMLDEFLIDNGSPMFSTEAFTNGALSRVEYMATGKVKKPYNIVTLVNGSSASASEVFASAMQEHGGYPVIGVTTFGKGTMQTDYKISATIGDSLHITIGKWFTSDNNWVHYDGGSDGVIPDVVVEVSENELAYKVMLQADDEILYDTVDSRVANIQVILNIMGYHVRTDGYFDIETRDAIVDIQVTNELLITGNIDSETLVFINEAIQEYQMDKLNDTQLNACIEYLITH